MIKKRRLVSNKREHQPVLFYRYLTRSTIFLLPFFLLLFLLAQPSAYAQSTPVCHSSGPVSAAYTVMLCLDAPADNATISGITDIEGSVTTVGTSPGVQRMVFYLGGEYLLTDFEAPYTFELPSDHFVDGTLSLEAEALMRDGFVTERTSITITLANGVTVPPVNTNTFTPITGTVTSGEPFVIAATGDGASGRQDAADVTDLIVNRDPEMFFYLGDVYEDGTYTEFFNWYGTTDRFFGRLRDITNPILGDHEYDDGQADGYFFYWDNVPDFYSVESAGWHIMLLNTNNSFDQFEPDTAQYDWLEQELITNPTHCKLVVAHNPYVSVGPKGGVSRMNDIWSLAAQHGVEVVLSGDDHSYQRWEPLDGSGNPDAQGVTQFVAGAGGQGVQAFATTDSRLVAGYDTPPMGFGSLFMTLNPDGMAFNYTNVANQVLDFGTIPCTGAPIDNTAPTIPANFAAPSNPNDEVLLTWDPSTDNTAVASYTLYRDGVELVTLNGANLSYTDDSALLGTNYTYTIDAVDPFGNRSLLSSGLNITTPATRLVTLTVLADSYVDGTLPSSNFGNSTILRTDATPELQSFMRFDVPTLNGFVTGSTLRVFANSSSGVGYAIHETTENNWDESSINYSNAPLIGPQLDSSGSFTAGSWIETNLPALDVQPGFLTLALLPITDSNISYSSREGDNAAELVVQLSATAAGTFTFTPVADTYVNASLPDDNFGSSPALRSDADPTINSYLRFDVDNLVGFIESATLRVYTNSNSNIGFDVHEVSDNSWGELVTTFNNAPAIGPMLNSSGAFAANNYIDIDVTAFVTGEGLVSFGIETVSNAAISLSSREGANTPELVIVTSENPPTGPQPGTFSFDAVADSYVNANSPDNNFGTSPLRADLSPQINSYLRFDVQQLVGVIDSVTLRIYANNGSPIGYDVHQVSDNSWDESLITFNNAPLLGTITGASGSFAADGYVEVDVTALVTSEGLITFGLSTQSNTAISLASRESLTLPQLVIETIEDPNPPTPTPTPTPEPPTPTPTPEPPTPTPTPAPPTPTPTPANSTTITAAADQDAWMKEQSPNENNGTVEELLVQEKSSDSTRTVYRFDLSAIPVGATINQATAHFWVTQSNGVPVNVHRIIDSWAENTVTWGNTGNDFDAQADGAFTPSNTDQFAQADLTSLTQEWVDGLSANYGIMLISTGNEEESKYSSRESSTSSQHPYMEITYTDNGGNQGSMGTFSSQVSIGTNDDNKEVALAIDSNDAAHVVFKADDDEITYTTNKTGSFSNPIEIGDDEDNKKPAIAIDGNDHISVVFEYDEDDEGIAYVADSGNGFSSVTGIGNDDKNKEPSVATHGNGHVHVVFEDDEDIYYTTSSGGSFSNLIEIGNNSKNKKPDIATNQNGDIFVVFEYDGGSKNIYYTTNSSGSFSTPIGIGNGDDNKQPAIAVGANNHVHVVFKSQDDIYYTTNQSGNFSTPLRLSGVDKGKQPDIAVDRFGSAHVVYEDDEDIYYTNNATGTFLPELKLSSGDKNKQPAIAVGHNSVSVAFEHDKDIHYVSATGLP